MNRTSYSFGAVKKAAEHKVVMAVEENPVDYFNFPSVALCFNKKEKEEVEEEEEEEEKEEEEEEESPFAPVVAARHYFMLNSSYGYYNFCPITQLLGHFATFFLRNLLS